MHKHIRPTFALNEPEAFVVVEPFNGSSHSFATHNNLVAKKTGRSQYNTASI
jgi:hypothetical protein